jgi:hypothetical protein
MVMAYPTYLKKAINLWAAGEGNKPIEGSYARAQFNEYGDNIFPRPECTIKDVGVYGGYFSSSKISEEMTKYWNGYNKYILSKGATLYMSCPPILSETLDPSVDLRYLQRGLDEELEFLAISKLEDYVYSSDLFYDTIFHLNETGKQLRTEQLINDLRGALAGDEISS